MQAAAVEHRRGQPAPPGNVDRSPTVALVAGRDTFAPSAALHTADALHAQAHELRGLLGCAVTVGALVGCVERVRAAARGAPSSGASERLVAGNR